MNLALESTDTSHIKIDDKGRAWIDDTNIKVIEVVRDHLAFGWSPEEIHWQHSSLSLAQIYAALAYYHDHRELMNATLNSSFNAAETSSQIGIDTALTRRLQRLLDDPK